MSVGDLGRATGRFEVVILGLEMTRSWFVGQRRSTLQRHLPKFNTTFFVAQVGGDVVRPGCRFITALDTFEDGSSGFPHGDALNAVFRNTVMGGARVAAIYIDVFIQDGREVGGAEATTIGRMQCGGQAVNGPRD